MSDEDCSIITATINDENITQEYKICKLKVDNELSFNEYILKLQPLDFNLYLKVKYNEKVEPSYYRVMKTDKSVIKLKLDSTFCKQITTVFNKISKNYEICVIKNNDKSQNIIEIELYDKEYITKFKEEIDNQLSLKILSEKLIEYSQQNPPKKLIFTIDKLNKIKQIQPGQEKINSTLSKTKPFNRLNSAIDLHGNDKLNKNSVYPIIVNPRLVKLPQYSPLTQPKKIEKQENTQNTNSFLHVRPITPLPKQIPMLPPLSLTRKQNQGQSLQTATANRAQPAHNQFLGPITKVTPKNSPTSKPRGKVTVTLDQSRNNIDKLSTSHWNGLTPVTGFPPLPKSPKLKS